MTLVYLLLGCLAIWLLHRFISGSAEPRVRLRRISESHMDSPTLVERDAWEGSFWEVETPFPASARLRFNYKDGSGNRTKRTVRVTRFGEHNGATLLIGHCLLRDATRTFRADRMRNCVDEETGEIISDVSAYLKDIYERAPERTKERFLEDQYDTLRVLLFVGKADGQFRADEKAIVKDLCVTLSSDPLLTDAIVGDLLGSTAAPSLQAFKLAAGRLSKRDPSFRAAVLAAAEKIVGLQKTVHPSEQHALDYIRKRFMEA